MRDEFGRLHKRTGSTFVLVTHNQDEALSLSDRMAIMHRGKLKQVGAPAEFFANPANEFVARFVGMERIIRPQNLDFSQHGTVATVAGEHLAIAGTRDVGADGVLALRPDRIGLATDASAAENCLSATITDRQYRGRFFVFHLTLKDGQTLDAEVPAEAAAAWPSDGGMIRIAFADGAIVPVPAGHA
jgi:spermidine/putrescine transport system ATP-binding protein